jgi:hypothetical protein
VSPLVLFLPAFVIASYGASALVPALALIATVKVTENSADYSLQNTAYAPRGRKNTVLKKSPRSGLPVATSDNETPARPSDRKL